MIFLSNFFCELKDILRHKGIGRFSGLEHFVDFIYVLNFICFSTPKSWNIRSIISDTMNEFSYNLILTSSYSFLSVRYKVKKFSFKEYPTSNYFSEIIIPLFDKMNFLSVLVKGSVWTLNRWYLMSKSCKEEIWELFLRLISLRDFAEWRNLWFPK